MLKNRRCTARVEFLPLYSVKNLTNCSQLWNDHPDWFEIETSLCPITQLWIPSDWGVIFFQTSEKSGDGKWHQMKLVQSLIMARNADTFTKICHSFDGKYAILLLAKVQICIFLFLMSFYNGKKEW